MSPQNRMRVERVEVSMYPVVTIDDRAYAVVTIDGGYPSRIMGVDRNSPTEGPGHRSGGTDSSYLLLWVMNKEGRCPLFLVAGGGRRASPFAGTGV
jgi:hypothetical protein